MSNKKNHYLIFKYLKYNEKKILLTLDDPIDGRMEIIEL